MKQQLQFPKKIGAELAKENISAGGIEGAFCPLPSAKGGSFFRGGAVTSAFMSAFL